MSPPTHAHDESESELQSKLLHSELTILELRDEIVGIQATYEELAFQMKVDIKNHLDHIKRLETALKEADRENGRLVSRTRELDAIYRSQSWQIVRALMLPIRVIRRLTRRT